MPAPLTFFSNINKLPAGHSLTFDLQDRTIRIERYWQYQPEPFDRRARRAADSAVEGVLPGNCRVRLFRASRRAGAACASRRRSPASSRAAAPSAVLAHMCPIYAVLAAPLARPVGVVFLWFTHWRKSRLLRAAEGSRRRS